MPARLHLTLVLAATLFLPCLTAAGQDPLDNPADEGFDAPKTLAPPQPKEFAFVFAMPYAIGDEYPREPEEFERMLVLLKGAGFNTVYCPYTDWRHELFKKHDMKIMIDVLAWKEPVETDIRRNPEQRARVKEICEQVRGSDAVWGYNLWNERLDWCGDFKKLDLWLRMLRTWDPTHPVWVGTYRYLYCEHYPTSPGVVAWYDYHWARGQAWNFKMLQFYRDISQKKQSAMGKWLLIHDYNRNLYTLNTSIAHGVKTVIWFIGGPYAAREPDLDKRWHEDMHLNRIGRHMRPLYQLIGEMGPAQHVYSTPTARTPDNKDKPLGLPADTVAFPEDHWLQIVQGEVICGFFDHPDGSEIVYVANHNAYAWQGVAATITQSDPKQPRMLDLFNRETGEWEEFGLVKRFHFPIPPADAAVLRLRPVSEDEAVDAADNPAAVVKTDWSPQQQFDEVADILRGKDELAAGNQPYAVYTATAGDLPAGAEAFPADHWLKVKQGELEVGFFKLKDGGDAVCFANRSHEAWQGALAVPQQDESQPTVIWELVGEEPRWEELGAWEDVNFPVTPGGRTVVKFRKKPSE